MPNCLAQNETIPSIIAENVTNAKQFKVKWGVLQPVTFEVVWNIGMPLFTGIYIKL